MPKPVGQTHPYKGIFKKTAYTLHAHLLLAHYLWLLKDLNLITDEVKTKYTWLIEECAGHLPGMYYKNPGRDDCVDDYHMYSALVSSAVALGIAKDVVPGIISYGASPGFILSDDDADIADISPYAEAAYYSISIGVNPSWFNFGLLLSDIEKSTRELIQDSHKGLYKYVRARALSHLLAQGHLGFIKAPLLSAVLHEYYEALKKAGGVEKLAKKIYVLGHPVFALMKSVRIAGLMK
jgi:hypothetical protein